MISCGIQCLNCDYPVHMDTYTGCSHACKYCFVKHQHDIDEINDLSSVRSLRDFIAGKRNNETRWCDWKIPLHWGANSDPFQECEHKYGRSLECLKVFAETKYPFIVSTKNPVMLCEDKYLNLLRKCNCVIQISMACSRYDKLESGAPKYEDRLEAARILANVSKVDRISEIDEDDKIGIHRVIARIQPYFPDAHKDILKELPRMSSAGIFGILIEGYRSALKQKGMEKRGGKLHKFPTELLKKRFTEIKEECHKVGLEFTCVEENLDWMSDNLTCCGTANMENYGFIPTPYNIARIAYAKEGEEPEPTEAMQKLGTTRPFKCIKQSQQWALFVKDKTYVEMIDYYAAEKVDRLREIRDNG